MKQLSSPIAERREFFRISDEVALRYRVMSEEAIVQAIERRQEGLVDANNLAASLASTNAEMKRAIEKLRRNLPDVASCLEAMSAKVDVLARLLMVSGGEFPAHPTHDVNVSASGLSFWCKEPLAVGIRLELKLLFFPSFTRMLTFANVVRCRETSDGNRPYDIGVEFSHIEENDRELLIKHVLQREATLLRQARGEPVSSPIG